MILEEVVVVVGGVDKLERLKDGTEETQRVVSVVVMGRRVEQRTKSKCI